MSFLNPGSQLRYDYEEATIDGQKVRTGVEAQSTWGKTFLPENMYV